MVHFNSRVEPVEQCWLYLVPTMVEDGRGSFAEPVQELFELVAACPRPSFRPLEGGDWQTTRRVETKHDPSYR